MKRLLIFGTGYSGKAIAAEAARVGFDVTGTARSEDGVAQLAARGWRALAYSAGSAPQEVCEALANSTHVLVSIAPNERGDPVLNDFSDQLAASQHLTWIGYLSTVGVYGDHAGAWVDEETTPRPVSLRSRHRVAAEGAWQDFSERLDARLQIFRLAGIYGPGRSAVEKLKKGKARRIIKPGQVFNRIHVDDIAQAVMAGLRGFGQHVIYNVSDDEPAPPQDVIAFAARALGMTVPPDVSFEEAGLSPMGRSFYSECKRVSNARLKSDLGIRLAYPTYREAFAVLAGSDTRERSSEV